MNKGWGAVIALGTNLPFEGVAGPALLVAALTALESDGLAINRISGFWTTPAWPDPNDPPFTNAVAGVQAPDDDPVALLDRLLAVERRFGRERSARNAPRTLDLDLLDFAGQTLATERLTLPHPRMAERAFVLGPLCAIAPDWRHPVTGQSAAALWRAVSGAAS